MGKDLPKMYQHKINKPNNNIQKIYTTMGNEVKDNINIKNDIYPNMSIDQKISKIFNSPDYVYKADVTIITDNDILTKRIVARNNNNLITIDNEYIPISIIRDIYK